MLQKIISGGQTGVDRAALDAGLYLKIPIGGYCTKGRKAEDGTIDLKYPLQETDGYFYPLRTEMNIVHSDATLIICSGGMGAGTQLTRQLCRDKKKLHTIVNFELTQNINLQEWIVKNNIKILNVAGSRESSKHGIYELTKKYLIVNLENEKMEKNNGKIKSDCSNRKGDQDKNLLNRFRII